MPSGTSKAITRECVRAELDTITGMIIGVAEAAYEIPVIDQTGLEGKLATILIGASNLTRAANISSKLSPISSAWNWFPAPRPSNFHLNRKSKIDRKIEFCLSRFAVRGHYGANARIG